MFLTKPNRIPFLLISTVTTTSKYIHNLINVPLMVTVLETFCTHNGVIFKYAIVTLKSFLWIHINTFCLSRQYFCTYIAFRLHGLKFWNGEIGSVSIVYEHIEVKISQNYFSNRSVLMSVSFEFLYNRLLIIVFIDSFGETINVKHTASNFKIYKLYKFLYFQSFIRIGSFISFLNMMMK